LTTHHIASDGWSQGVFFRELAALYAAFCEGQATPLPELDIQYADFAVWQREWLSGTRLEQQIDYWKTRLAGAPAVLTLPTDRPRPAFATHRGASAYIDLPRTLAAELEALSKSEGATLFMTLL